MRIATCRFATLSLAAVLGAGIVPIHGATYVQGAVYSNPSTIFDTGQQTGSPLSEILIWTCTTCSSYGFSADGKAKVINGSMGVVSTINVTGTPGDSASHSIAQYDDTFTVTGGSGDGVLQLTYSLDGSITQTAPGAYNTSLGFGTYGPSVWQLDGGTIHHDGLTSGPALLGDGTKSDTVTFYLPFTYGTPFGKAFFMNSTAGFAHSTDSAPYTAAVDFYNTATPSSALVFNGPDPLSLGPQNTSALVTTGSGLQYTPGGVVALTPEPGDSLLFSSVLGFLALLKLRKRRRQLEPGRRAG